MRKRILILILLLLFPLSLKGYNVTDQLLIDIKINNNGSALVKEIATLEGEYQGRLRDIGYINPNAPIFEASNPNFAGNSLYNATDINSFIVGDIKYKNKYSWADFDNINRVYTLDNSRDEKYNGVYEMDITNTSVDFKIYNNTKNAFYLEYRLENVVVVHNDVAEFAWNIIGNTYKEYINELRVRIMIPNKDEQLRAWLHGTLDSFGEIRINDNPYVEIIYKDLTPYNPISTRIMFNKDLVPNSNKRSGINAKEGILAYEQGQADLANAQREKNYQVYLNQVKTKFNELKTTLDSKLYFELIEEIKYLKPEDRNPINQELLNDSFIKSIDKSTLEKYEQSFAILKRKKTSSYYEQAKTYSDLIIDDNKRVEKQSAVSSYEEIVHTMFTKRLITIVIGTFAMVLISIYLYYSKHKENNRLSSFDHDYYRDFPTDDLPSVVQHMVLKKADEDAFSATILDLITKKIITVEEIGKKDFLYTKTDKTTDSEIEQKALSILFDLIGNNNQVKSSEIKKFSNREQNARKLLKEYNKFTKLVLAVNTLRGYYNPPKSKYTKYLLYLIPIYIFLMMFAWYYEIGLTYFFITFFFLFANIIHTFFVGRSVEGVDSYKKWRAHKRFLEDFGTFEDKELPEIHLWEKYLVYATALGVANKLQKQMKIKIKEWQQNDQTFSQTYVNYVILNNLLNNDIASSVAQNINSSVRDAQSVTTPSASGGGFGGGSSGGGGSFGGGGGGGRF